MNHDTASFVNQNKQMPERRIPYAAQWLDDADIQAVVDVLKNDFLTTGPKIAEFEAALCEITEAKYAVAVNSGTAALHAACFAAGISDSDEVITSPITFAATANAVLYVGGTPVFCDIDPETWNIDPSKIEALITAKTKAIIPVHFTGQPCQMDRILEIAKKHRLVVIEDAAHALGARFNGKPVGSIGAMTCFSFHPVKHITTGEGGAVTTDSRELYQKLIQFRAHGITRDAELLTYATQNGADSEHSSVISPVSVEPWYYEQHFLGFNYRLTDIQAALGVSQLKKLPAFLQRRKDIVRTYNDAFQPLHDVGKLQLPAIMAGANSAWHLFVIKLPPEHRNRVFHALQEKGLNVNLHYIPVYLHPYYRQLGYREGLCPEAEFFYSGIITLPLYPKMSDDDVAYVIRCIRETVSS